MTFTVTSGRPSGSILLEFPALAGRIASASAGTVGQSAGTVKLGRATHQVTVRLGPASRAGRHAG